jgi:hypothetical protein
MSTYLLANFLTRDSLNPKEKEIFMHHSGVVGQTEMETMKSSRLFWILMKCV